uniref:VWFA domain-containing protein n=1 Tax=Sinocyclocheilus rhinocerous TaxID=307959 RepID=A0A673G2A5_9TELE
LTDEMNHNNGCSKVLKRHSAVEMYHDQIKWLGQGNRKVFGVVNGSRVGVLVDTSDLTCSTERLALIDEQLRFKKQLHLLSYGSEVSSLWDKPLDTCPLRWVTLFPQHRSHTTHLPLHYSIKQVFLCHLLDIFFSPDQTVDVICDFLTQNRMPCVHAVAYSCSSPAAIVSIIDGLYVICRGTFLIIWLVLANSCVRAAQKLDLYQLLARNAYSPQEMFVPVLGKTVSSTVHERVMVRFEWHDGTVKNLHVDLPSLQKYQKRLMGAVHLFERRVQWLNRTGSQQIWGTVCEQRVQVLLDMSGMNAHYQLHIQHAIRILLQEQLANKHSFNVIVFGSDVKSWQEKMVPSTHENLQAVWLWIQAVECVRGRNTLAALRCALEEEAQEESSLTRGVYLLTTGMPDQHMVSVTAYVSERCSATNLNLHVCLFTGEEDTARCPLPHYATRTETARALSGLAHAGNGRFLWMTDTGEKRLSYECLNDSVIFKKYPKSKSVRKSIATVKLPKHEDICSTKQVLYSITTGSRRVFGSVLEKMVCVLLDVSGSMAPCLPELQKELTLLIWDQLHANSVRFNMLAFSGEVRMWQPALVQSTEELCVEAVQWLNQLSTHGASSTLQALQTGCGFADAVGLYLITDGRCDSSHSRILTEIETLRQEKDFTVHTIAVNCHDRLTCIGYECGQLYRSFDPVLPKCEGDDLRKLSEEIEKLRLFQKQAKAFRFVFTQCLCCDTQA